MCNPMAFMAAGTLMQVSGQISGGRAAEANARMEAADLEYQAAVEQDNALQQAQQIRRAGQRARGETLGGIVASGVKVGEGSALDAEREVVTDAAVDERLAIWRGEQAGRQLNTRADLTRRAGRQARRAANFSAFTTLMGSAAQGMQASGFGARGPGFSGQQAPAPVIEMSRRI